MPREKTKQITTIGGQALIEGILMRGPKKSAVAVRLEDGTIDTEEMGCQSLREKYPVLRWPLPVSYTHLDVYKRQGLEWMPRI